MIVSKEVRVYFSKKLSLPASGAEQDWEIEMSDAKRINEFIAFYKQNVLPGEEYENSLISLILHSIEEYLYKEEIFREWEIVKQILLFKKDSVKELLQEWALHGEEDQHYWFKLTPLIRDIGQI